MHLLQQMKQQLQQLKKLSSEEIVKGCDETGTPFLKILFEVYQYYFREVCTTCPAKIAGYIRQIKNLNPNKMEKSNFILKKQAIIVIPGTSEAYSNANLTDEVAIKFLKENSNRKSLFVQLPENLDQLLSDEQVEKPFIERPQAEILPLIVELDLEQAQDYIVQENAKAKPRAKVIEGLEKRIAEFPPVDLLEDVNQNKDLEDENELDFDSVTEVSDEQVEED